MDLTNTESLPEELKEGIKVRKLVKGQRLFRQGDRAKNLYVVKAGRIELVRSNIESKLVILQIIEPGESLGETVIFCERYTCTAIAEIDATVITYPQELLESIIKQYPELIEDLAKKLISKIQILKKNIELRSIKNSDLRVLQYLRYLAASQESREINLERSFKAISGELGITPETISRALVKLEQEGRISRQKNYITLHILS